MKTAYKLRFLPLALLLPTFLVVLALRFILQMPISDRTLLQCGLLAFVAFIFLQAMRQYERERKQKAENPAPNTKQEISKSESPMKARTNLNEVWMEIPVKGVDDEASPVIRVFSDNISFLLTEWFPWEGKGSFFTEEMIVKDMATFIGAKVSRDDRDRFLIMSNDYPVISKTLIWFDKKIRRLDKSDKMQVIRAYMSCGDCCAEAFQQYKSKGLLPDSYLPDLFPFEDFLYEEFPEEFLMWVDWREEDDAIIRYCENILQTKALSAKSVSSNDDPLGFELIITYKGMNHKVMYPGEDADRDTTIITLNEVLAPDYEIRFFVVSGGGDTLAFLPLSAQQWAELEETFGDEQLERHFAKIHSGLKMFE